MANEDKLWPTNFRLPQQCKQFLILIANVWQVRQFKHVPFNIQRMFLNSTCQVPNFKCFTSYEIYFDSMTDYNSSKNETMISNYKLHFGIRKPQLTASRTMARLFLKLKFLLIIKLNLPWRILTKYFAFEGKIISRNVFHCRRRKLLLTFATKNYAKFDKNF